MRGLHIRPSEPVRAAIRDVLRGALDALILLALGASIIAVLIHVLWDGWR